jgi:hypothetical protein
VSLIEQQGGEERYVGTPIRVSEASVAISDSRPNTDASKSRKIEYSCSNP